MYDKQGLNHTEDPLEPYTNELDDDSFHEVSGASEYFSSSEEEMNAELGNPSFGSAGAEHLLW